MTDDLKITEKTDVAIRFEDERMGEHVEFMFGRDGLDVECNSDWAGCTETGFGERISKTISVAMARELYSWLGRALLAHDAEAE